MITGAVEVNQAEESGVPLDQVNRFDTSTDLLGALQEGRIDAHSPHHHIPGKPGPNIRLHRG